MDKVHPQFHVPSSSPSPSSSSSSFSSSSSSENFTLWMKSLVMNGNGCAVYSSDGKLAYRVDNYGYKCSDEVYLMNHTGKTLTAILRKKISLFRQWNGYRCDRNSLTGEEEQRPWFRVRKARRVLKAGGQPNEHTVIVGSGNADCKRYKIVGLARKSEYKIVSESGVLVAQVKTKHSVSGVSLGDDVLTLVVEPNVDHMLIMGLVVVSALIDGTI